MGPRGLARARLTVPALPELCLVGTAAGTLFAQTLAPASHGGRATSFLVGVTSPGTVFSTDEDKWPWKRLERQKDSRVVSLTAKSRP